MKRCRDDGGSGKNTSFISHIVQMKLARIGAVEELLSLYIPHSSDETYRGRRREAYLCTLYPT